MVLMQGGVTSFPSFSQKIFRERGCFLSFLSYEESTLWTSYLFILIQLGFLSEVPVDPRVSLGRSVGSTQVGACVTEAQVPFQGWVFGAGSRPVQRAPTTCGGGKRALACSELLRLPGGGNQRALHGLRVTADGSSTEGCRALSESAAFLKEVELDKQRCELVLQRLFMKTTMLFWNQESFIVEILLMRRGFGLEILGKHALVYFSGGSDSKESTCSAGDPGWVPGWEDPLEVGMKTHSRILAW